MLNKKLMIIITIGILVNISLVGDVNAQQSVKTIEDSLFYTNNLPSGDVGLQSFHVEGPPSLSTFNSKSPFILTSPVAKKVISIISVIPSGGLIFTLK